MKSPLPIILAAIALILCQSQCRAAEVVLAPTFIMQDVLTDYCASPQKTGIRVETGGCVGAFNNIQSLWDVTDKKMAPQSVDTNELYARLRFGQWVCLSSGNWFVGAGSGFRDIYDGNHDAGQLWIDLHTTSRSQTDYYPSANDLHIATSWYGIGRNFGFHARGVEGNCKVFARCIKANDFLARSLDGSVSGDDFSGNVRIVTSSNSSQIYGRGWSLDARSSLKIGKKWEGVVAVEGILGEIQWDGVSVQDMYVVSPRVFTDPEGFYHDTGGISGVSSKRNLRLNVGRNCRIDLLRKGKRVDLLAGYMCEEGYDSIPNIGAAFRRGKWWTPYARLYPTESRCELGAAGHGWLLSISGDDWLFSSPQHAAINLSIIAGH